MSTSRVISVRNRPITMQAIHAGKYEPSTITVGERPCIRPHPAKNRIEGSDSQEGLRMFILGGCVAGADGDLRGLQHSERARPRTCGWQNAYPRTRSGRW